MYSIQHPLSKQHNYCLMRPLLKHLHRREPNSVHRSCLLAYYIQPKSRHDRVRKQSEETERDSRVRGGKQCTARAIRRPCVVRARCRSLLDSTAICSCCCCSCFCVFTADSSKHACAALHQLISTRCMLSCVQQAITS